MTPYTTRQRAQGTLPRYRYRNEEFSFSRQIPSGVGAIIVKLDSQLIADRGCPDYVNFVPEADVMLIIDEMIWLERTLSQLLLQNDNDDGEP